MSRKKNNSIQLGARLEDGHHHDHSHELWSRRNFLSTLGLGGGSGLMLGQVPLIAFAQSKLQKLLAEDESERILLLIRLKGGNDGLNTIIPLTDYDYYRSARPTVGLTESQLLPLTDEVAVPNFMSDIEGLWKEGAMKVIRNVGYENQNLSHFTSSDIWAKSSESLNDISTGWLGRYFDGQYPDFALNPPQVPPAILIGYSSNLIFSGSSADMGFTVSNPEELNEIAQTGSLYDVRDVPNGYFGEQLAFTRTIANNTTIFSEAIHNAYIKATNDVDYFDGWRDDATRYFADQMSLVSRLIKGRLGTKIFMVELRGFDTHEGQPNVHEMLLRALSKGISRFYEDLGASAQENDVLTMTISEFGRRVEENGSLGTDHGAGAPMLFFGPTLSNSNEQLIGQAPNIRDTDRVGNITADMDFRSAYATVLENWFCLGAEEVNQVLLDDYQRIDGLGISCSPLNTSIQRNSNQPSILHYATYTNDGKASIHFELPTDANVSIEIFDVQGRTLQSDRLGIKHKGIHQYNLSSRKNTLQLAFYKLTVDRYFYSGKIRLF